MTLVAQILIVDDQEGVRSFLAGALEEEGHEIIQAADGRAALVELARRQFDVILTDLKMPGADGLAVLKQARAADPDVQVIVLTAHGTVQSAVDAMKLGAFDYLEKPLGSPAELRLVVGRAVERRQLLGFREAATRGVRERKLTWGAPAMAAVVDAITRVARTPATVLLLGESGVGKEVAARAVHERSERSGGPFVAVNCAALSATLLESELFGHEKGAFTGAAAQRRGRVEHAAGGTFFLDEIGDLHLDLQAKLLRVLQERSFERLGGNRTITVDVRWIAATNRDLEAMVADGSFRPDLYHRLAVFPVRIPPLRERREDVLPLARALLADIAAELGRPILRLDEDAERALAAAAWPGNIRQLRNVLERAAILGDGPVLGAQHLPAAGAPELAAEAVSPLQLDELERDAIVRALASTAGNRRKAATALGIGLRTLYEKLKRYGIP